MYDRDRYDTSKRPEILYRLCIPTVGEDRMLHVAVVAVQQLTHYSDD
jgi:hypothetical protein